MKRIETTEEKKRFMTWLPVSMVTAIQKHCAGEMTQSSYIHDLVEADMAWNKALEGGGDGEKLPLTPYEP